MSTIRTPKKVKASTSKKDQNHTNEWLQIALLIVFISSLIVSFGVGIRVGTERGEKKAVEYMMKKIEDHLSDKCIGQLADNLRKDQ